jgi:hypothetical protein
MGRHAGRNNGRAQAVSNQLAQKRALLRSNHAGQKSIASVGTREN